MQKRMSCTINNYIVIQGDPNMKNFIQSILRTPGVLFMNLLMFGFAINAGVAYIHSEPTAGPSLLAVMSLAVAQVALIVIHQLRKFGEKNVAESRIRA